MPLSDEPYISHRQNLKLVGYECTVIKDDHSSLTKDQKCLVDYFAKRTQGKRLANRQDLNPAEIVSYLPNVILFDLKMDENKKITDVIVRLVGTAAADFYGEYTGYSLFDDIFDKSVTEARDRLVSEAEIIVGERLPMTTFTEQRVADGPNVQLNTLKIPFAANGKDIDMLFMYLEVSTK